MTETYKIVTHNSGLLKLVRVLSKTVGRDKLTRIVQYFTRFLAYYYRSKGILANATLFSSVSGDLSFIRKAMRLLKPLEHIANIGKTLDTSTGVSRWAGSLKELSFVFYLFFDLIIFLKRLKVVGPKTIPKAALYGARIWAVGVSFGVINDLAKIYSGYKSLKALQVRGEKDYKNSQAIEASLYSAKRRLGWDLLDLYVSLNLANVLNSNEGSVALAGTITSLMGLEDVWKSA